MSPTGFLWESSCPLGSIIRFIIFTPDWTALLFELDLNICSVGSILMDSELITFKLV